MYEIRLVCGICGGDIKPDENGAVGSCVNCGSSGMYPKGDIKIFNRITYLRNTFKFDAAEKLAKKLTEANPADSAAYWALMLCEYGIQYVRDGGKRVPVCRKDISALPAPKESASYKSAAANAADDVRAKYEALADTIEDTVSLTKTILAQDKSYDVFILSPEGVAVEDDLDGDKIYLRFTSNLNFSVFYAPELLKEADAAERAAQTTFALKHSRIMLPSFRTSSNCHDGYFEYAVKIFCAELQSSKDKLVFPIFDSSAVKFQQIPECLVYCENVFDCSEDEFMREISDKVEAILKPEVNAIVPEDIVTATAANKENLIKRAYMFLEDGEFDTADSYFDKILDIDIEDSRAYIGKLLAECKLRNEEAIASLPQTVTDDKNFKKALRFASPEQKAHYEALNNAIVKRIEDERREIAEQHAKLKAEREEKEAIERARRARQEKEERKLLYQRRRDPMRKTLLEVQAELAKALITPKRRKELQEQEATLKKNLKDLDDLFPDIFD
ncbi:MAG: hypothetical protein K5876_00460 [Ruminiclostridium sp.]|nr:hypothetical protein [Ruminiclostridium sp.]